MNKNNSIYASWVMAIVILLAIPVTTQAKNIERAFGVTLGQEIDESILTSKLTESETFPGALHANFRPNPSHPLLREYSVWVTYKSKTVVAIRGFSKEKYSTPVGPEPSFNASKRKKIDWEREKFKAERKYRSVCKKFRRVFKRITTQLEGLYGDLHSWKKRDRGFSGYRYFGRKAFEDSKTNAKITFDLRCRNNSRKRVNGEVYSTISLIYELNDLKKMLSREAKSASGL